MKKYFIPLSACILTPFFLKGQCDIRMYDIYTAYNSEVVTFLMCESSQARRASLDDHYAQTYPNATQIKTYDGYSSTAKFNCHGYAWLRVEREIDRWIGTGWDEWGECPLMRHAWNYSPYGTLDLGHHT